MGESSNASKKIKGSVMSPGIRQANNRWVLGLVLLAAGAGAQAQTATTATSSSATPVAARTQELPPQGNAERGKTLYQSCTSCHSIDENDIGPKHRGVVGRKAGTAPDYAYSAALKSSGIVWDKANLDRWLTNPSAMVPGTKMFFFLKNPQDRADIIAYLAELK
jgi:cytochrome c